MKKIYFTILASAVLLGSACSKEIPFMPDEQQGQILKSALSMDIKDEALTHLKETGTRAGANVTTDDFTVVFSPTGQNVTYASYKYSEMPEVIALPVGTYNCIAYYGEDRPADWENPFYKGVSEPFEISAYEITSYIEPIECRLENVQVSIDFDPSLKAVMSEDAYVEVKIGDSSSLSFGVAEAEAGKSGYFRHTSESSLVAVFNGEINGVRTVESKSMDNIVKGHHYRIQFKLHDHNGTDSGDSDAQVSVDASVTVTDVEYNVDTIEDEILDDSERPTEGGGEPGPVPPGQEDPEVKGPELTVNEPIQLDVVNVYEISKIDGNEKLVLEVKSATGLTTFTCDIISNTLNKDKLEDFNLSSHIDMIDTPEEYVENLVALGFPVNIGGEKSATLDLSTFVQMMAALGQDTHEFRMTLGDSTGTITKSLILKFI